MARTLKVKLGKKAGNFFDSATRLKVLPNQVVTVTPEQAKSQRFRAALANNWLVETDEEVTTTKVAEETGKETTESEFASMTKAELMAYLEENYDLDEEETKRVGKLNKDDLVSYVEELEAEEEE